MKNEKILYFWEYLKIAYFKQNCNLWYSGQQKYTKLIVVIVKSTYDKFIRKYVTVTQFTVCYTIRSFNTLFPRITNLSSIQWFPFFNNLWWWPNSLCWQCMAYYRSLWNSWNGNTWPLYVHIAEVTLHGRPHVTLVESAAHYVSRSVLSFPMKTFVEFIPLQQFSWF